MRTAIVVLFSLGCFTSCGGPKQKEEEKGGETFEKMVILEEVPSEAEAAYEKAEYKIR